MKSNLDFELKLAEKLRCVAKESLPERDLWPGIELALVDQAVIKEPANRFNKVSLIAASVLVLSFIAWSTFEQFNRPLNDSVLVANLSEQHQLQKQALLVQVKGQPALTQNWQEQLKVLDKAELAIKAALKNEPNNMALLKLLQNVYQQQINLIERVHSPKWTQI
ncbi:hypothetical protein [Flavobacterium sp. W21_SRS_FM6]|uniref:hypothetical protein n=1 Tax=Flavobacterium sp. W21_SRS_FM6 TaxID=3240268 RepID=UPI003F8F3E38